MSQTKGLNSERIVYLLAAVASVAVAIAAVLIEGDLELTLMMLAAVVAGLVCFDVAMNRRLRSFTPWLLLSMAPAAKTVPTVWDQLVLSPTVESAERLDHLGSLLLGLLVFLAMVLLARPSPELSKGVQLFDLGVIFGCGAIAAVAGSSVAFLYDADFASVTTARLLETPAWFFVGGIMAAATLAASRASWPTASLTGATIAALGAAALLALNAAGRTLDNGVWTALFSALTISAAVPAKAMLGSRDDRDRQSNVGAGIAIVAGALAAATAIAARSDRTAWSPGWVVLGVLALLMFALAMASRPIDAEVEAHRRRKIETERASFAKQRALESLRVGAIDTETPASSLDPASASPASLDPASASPASLDPASASPASAGPASLSPPLSPLKSASSPLDVAAAKDDAEGGVFAAALEPAADFSWGPERQSRIFHRGGDDDLVGPEPSQAPSAEPDLGPIPDVPEPYFPKPEPIGSTPGQAFGDGRGRVDATGDVAGDAPADSDASTGDGAAEAAAVIGAARATAAHTPIAEAATSRGLRANNGETLSDAGLVATARAAAEVRTAPPVERHALAPIEQAHFFDPSTGLLSAAGLQHALATAFVAPRKAGHVTIMMFTVRDLDRIEDEHGRLASAAVTREVAERIRALLPDGAGARFTRSAYAILFIGDLSDSSETIQWLAQVLLQLRAPVEGGTLGDKIDVVASMAQCYDSESVASFVGRANQGLARAVQTPEPTFVAMP